MKKISTTLSALTIAAALMMNLTACTNDDNTAIDTPEQPEAVTPVRLSTVQVTVGAGIDGDDATRSAVGVDYDYNGSKQRKQKFTDGDKLFVFANMQADYDYFVAGTLSIVASTIGDDGTTAQFSGTLAVYHFESGTPVPSSYAFTDAEKPLEECNNFEAYLVAKDMREGCYTIEDYWNYKHDYTKCIAVDDPDSDEDDPDSDEDDCVSTLMTTALKVSTNRYETEYVDDGGPKMFRGFDGDPILNCTISGLQDGTAYTVTLLGDGNEEAYNNLTGEVVNVTYDTAVTATDGGTARFAICPNDDFLFASYWTLKLVGGGSTYLVRLGQKSMRWNKVYNVTREATAQQ